jgi:hypothetical protein
MRAACAAKRIDRKFTNNLRYRNPLAIRPSPGTRRVER